MTNQESLIVCYRAMIERGELHPDPAQNFVIEKLSLLAQRLKREDASGGGFAFALFGWGREPVRKENLRGEYIYGAVGRGKSMLMQLFVDEVGDMAQRAHFHEFMQMVHKKLGAYRKAGGKEPIVAIAEDMAKTCQVLCLDEMQIENIADAMIVGRLFEAIFARGIVLVTTSNRRPDDLYKGGLNRHRFVPFIEEIKTHCEIVSLDGAVDYRLGGDKITRYFVNDQAGFDAAWDALPGKEVEFKLDLGGREWVMERVKAQAVRLHFADVCETARGAADYHALADRFDKIFLDHVPLLNHEKTSAAARFVTLIDVLYEAGVILYLRLDAPVDALHDDRDTAFLWARTRSRLEEMQRVNWGVS